MSTGKNGNINTIYNIGKMQNWEKIEEILLMSSKARVEKPLVTEFLLNIVYHKINNM